MNMKKLQQNLRNEVKYIKFKEHYENLINETPEIKNDLELFELELNSYYTFERYKNKVIFIFRKIRKLYPMFFYNFKNC